LTFEDFMSVCNAFSGDQLEATLYFDIIPDEANQNPLPKVTHSSVIHVTLVSRSYCNACDTFQQVLLQCMTIVSRSYSNACDTFQQILLQYM